MTGKFAEIFAKLVFSIHETPKKKSIRGYCDRTPDQVLTPSERYEPENPGSKNRCLSWLDRQNRTRAVFAKPETLVQDCKSVAGES